MGGDPKYFDRIVFRRLGRAVLILAGILMFGTFGYYLVEANMHRNPVTSTVSGAAIVA